VSSPFPEELNRQAIARIAQLNFSPTSLAASNLGAEGIPSERICITGNTVVEASDWLSENYLQNSEWLANQTEIFSHMGLPDILEKRFCLVTLHRRENQGSGFRDVLNVIRTKAKENPGFSFVFPVHPNPNISRLAREILGGLANVNLIPPLDYLHFSVLLAYSSLIISDSGGVQEEAVTFGKKVLIAREATERPEGLNTGLMELVGGNSELIELRLQEVIDSQNLQTGWSLNLAKNPFGEGKASKAICDALESLKL
jgi:UDP-N-acetylglucosamine 2-epimerase (non-hydrolysing)